MAGHLAYMAKSQVQFTKDNEYYTPKVLFDILKESFNVYVNASIEDKIEREKNKIIANLQETGDLGIDYLDSKELEKEAKKLRKQQNDNNQ